MTKIETYFGSRINSGLLIMRIIIGMIFFMHGIAKFTIGIHAITAYFIAIGIPLAGLCAWLVTFIETFGGLALILGVGTRIASLLFILMMIITLIALAPLHIPFISTQDVTGYELNLALVAALLPILILGPGRYSVARAIVRND